MEDHTGYRLLLVFFIIALNAFFAAAEVALITTRRSRLRELADTGNVGAQAAVSLLEDPARLLSVTQVGVTFASLGLGWAGGQTVYRLLESTLSPLISPSAATVLHGVSFALAFLAISYLHVVAGEVIPKNLAVEKADRLSVIIAPALLVFYRITEPFVATIERSAAILSRLIGLTPSQSASGHSAEELRYLIRSCDADGPLEAFERQVLQRVLDLADYSAREIMVPRTAAITVSVDSTLDQILRSFLDHQYSRLPVYEQQPENWIGTVHFKDLMRVWEERRIAQDRKRPVRPFRLRRIIRKPLVIPETKPLNQLIDEFRTERMHMAIVVDEFGTITGLVTMEDVLEQLFGEIEDEHDELRAKPSTEENVLEIEGATPIRDLHTQYGIELSGEAGFETVAGFLLHQIGDIPKVGQVVEQDGRRFTILQMERNRISSVRIEKPQ